MPIYNLQLLKQQTKTSAQTYVGFNNLKFIVNLI